MDRIEKSLSLLATLCLGSTMVLLVVYVFVEVLFRFYP